MEVKVFEIGTASKEAEELGGTDGVGKGGLCDVERGEVKRVDRFRRGETGCCYLHGYMSGPGCPAREDIVVVVPVGVKGSLEAEVEVVEDAAGGGEGEIGESGVGCAVLERQCAVQPARQVGEEAGHDGKEALKVGEVELDAEGEGRRAGDPQLGLRPDGGDVAGRLVDDDELPWPGRRERDGPPEPADGGDDEGRQRRAGARRGHEYLDEQLWGQRVDHGVLTHPRTAQTWLNSDSTTNSNSLYTPPCQA